MTPLYTPAEARNAVELLASRSLIRLVTEIDDNGAIPARRLADNLPDLSAHQLRHATEAARKHGLVRVAPGFGLELTDAGAELADLYDVMARWARRHAYPAPVCEFSSRIRYVLDLLATSAATEGGDGLSRPSTTRLTSAEAGADLARPRTLLIQWLAGNPQVTGVSESEPVA
ncbi:MULTISPECIES: regulator [unclassified Streptomyces]|uniref:regulator n=1 Tax=unclassified Streptomyces TaxID=2593676 RepID=UPI002365AC09|nr:MULTISPECIES: regulator [unclassified Streptomyces]MDF3146944.1 regulator [Streptomyces sp. T21Q-yed]WDF43547.1 regulator [Streptomyces sp. T12]